jgi:integration host factor subunit beta
MTKKDILLKLEKTLPHFPKTTLHQALDIFFESIAATLENKGRVELRGFGNFFLRKREAYTGLNPQTQEKLSVQEKWVVFFKSSSLLKKNLIEVENKTASKTSIFSLIYRDLKSLKRPPI